MTIDFSSSQNEKAEGPMKDIREPASNVTAEIPEQSAKQPVSIPSNRFGRQIAPRGAE
jgi:hypothetical protein